MKWRLRRQENPRGEWSVMDPALGYRICRYNHPHHGGTHVHHPEDGKPWGKVDVKTPQEAEAVMRRYHRTHKAFNLERLKKEVASWRSRSSAE